MIYKELLQDNRVLSLLLPLIILVIPIGDITAQNKGKVTGTITDKTSEDVLIGASVQVVGTSKGAVSNLNGEYTITQVDPGTYQLEASYLGYNRQVKEVEVTEGQEVEVNFILEPVSLEGEEVVISAQARGQTEAINRQRQSNKIVNVVSEARIKELPDVNAAESVGRLPGISIQRSGGEANKVAIRGLSPKYNNITVNGVRMPSTGADDRSVDLSTISSNMLDGIVVTKANTPDQDADALGGTVDLELKTAPSSDFQFDVSGKGGYNDLENEAENFGFSFNGSKRFLNDDLGIIGSFNIDSNNRSSDEFSGGFREGTSTAGETVISFDNAGFRNGILDRDRTGGSVVLDYQLTNGQIKGSFFYNKREDEGIFRQNLLNVTGNSLSYSIEERNSETEIANGMISLEQDFGWMSMDLMAARSTSMTENPRDFTWLFTQDGGTNLSSNPNTTAEDLISQTNRLITETGFREASIQTTDRDENETTTKFDFRVPFQLNENINGYFKTGGKLRWLNRFNDENQIGRGGLVYGNTSGPNTTLECASQFAPGFNIQEQTAEFGLLPISAFETGFTESDFLDGQFSNAFPQGFGPRINSLKAMTIALNQECGEFIENSIGSLSRDYDGIERYQAGYVMAEINLGDHITFLPGIRYENDFSRYSAFRFREVTQNNTDQEPADLEELTVERSNDFWLPMIHINARPTSWMNVRFAYTQTISRPDFIQLAPITTINSFQTFVDANNSQLRPSLSENFDLTVSIFNNKFGFFSVTGFYKSIEDLIFQREFNFREGIEPLPGMNIPPAWLEANPNGITDINNPFETSLKGVEIDWQANFWFLPKPLDGLVFNLNYTALNSSMKVQDFDIERERIQLRPFPIFENTLVDTFRTARLPDQPSDILNLSVGYDYKGFSARVSLLWQTETLTFIDESPALDNFTGTLKRWDASVKQQINESIEVFGNVNNFSNRPDEQFRGEELVSPTFRAFFGFTADAGIRYHFR